MFLQRHPFFWPAAWSTSRWWQLEMLLLDLAVTKHFHKPDSAAGAWKVEHSNTFKPQVSQQGTTSMNTFHRFRSHMYVVITMKSTIAEWLEVPAVFKGFKLIQLGDRVKDKIIVKRNSKQSWDPCVEGVSLFCHVSSNPNGASFAALGKRRSCRRVAFHVTKKKLKSGHKNKIRACLVGFLKSNLNECRVQLLYKTDATYSMCDLPLLW